MSRATLVRVLFKAYDLPIQEPAFFTKVIRTVQDQMTYDKEVLATSIFEHDAALMDDLKLALIKFKSHLNEKLMAASQPPKVMTTDQANLGKAFEAFEIYLLQWNFDLRGNYVRSGQRQLDDGTIINVELSDLAAEDERGEFAPVICDEKGQEIETLRSQNFDLTL